MCVSHVAGAGSNPGIDVVYAVAWTNNERSAGVNDGITATRTGHSLSIDSNTVENNRELRINRNIQCVQGFNAAKFQKVDCVEWME